MSKAIIIYSTRSGQTKAIGELVAEGLRIAAVDVTMADVKDIKKVEKAKESDKEQAAEMEDEYLTT